MIKVKLSRLNITPRKVRLVAKLIKGKSVEQAITQLTYLGKRAAAPILKLLASGLDIASKRNFNKQDLVIQNIITQEGPKRRKMLAGSRGRARPITKRTSHIELTLNQKK